MLPGRKIICLVCFANLLMMSGCSKDVVPFLCGSSVEYSGMNYRTVQIGDQCWMTDNLNIGQRMDGSQNQIPANGFIEKYCQEDNESYCDVYGGLYQWNEAMGGEYKEGVRGICPEGWHIPSDDEWTLLFERIGGKEIAGRVLKSNQGWYLGGNGSDSLHFTALPGGNRDYDGIFYNLSKTAVFWSSTSFEGVYAYSNKLGYQHDNTYRNYYNKKSGFSVRCIKTL